MDRETRTNYPEDDTNYAPQFQKETDNRHLLPTDDQLDRFVDTLCDNFPILQLEETFKTCEITEQNSCACNVSSNSPATNNFLVAEKFNSRNEIRKPVLAKRSTNSNKESKEKSKTVNEKKSFYNNNLNFAIVQCAGSLESIIQKRKSLELLMQIHRQIFNINYNFSYSPRLPDSPTRVDRLIFDINQERCRILGLMSLLEDTINSFSSKHTKDDFRKLLIAYGEAIVDVIKERQHEINSGIADNNTGVLKLVELITEVHRMNRLVHTALWCIEVREQMNLVMLRRNLQKTLKSFEGNQNLDMTSQKWHATKLMQEKQLVSPRVSRVFSTADLQYRQGRAVHPHQSNTQSNSSAKQKKITLSHSQSQQKRTETIQRFFES